MKITSVFGASQLKVCYLAVLVLLTACSTSAPVRPASEQVAVEFARADERIGAPISVSLAFTPKFSPGVVAGNGRQAQFAFDAARRCMTCSAVLHGKTGVFALATGMRHTIVSSALINKALPPTRTTFLINQIAGSVTQRLECVPVFALAYGDVVYTNFDVVVGIVDDGIDGVIGANLLLASPVTVDFRCHRVVFELPADADKWHAARCSLDNGVPTVALDVNGISVPCRIDTGAPCSTMPRSLYKGSVDENKAAALPEAVLLNGISIKHNVSFKLVDGSAATLGLDFIERHAVAFDMRSRTLYFRTLPH